MLSYRLIVLLIFFIHLGERKTSATPTSLAELELSKIISKQRLLFKKGSRWSETELIRQAQEIVTQYESYLLENSNDTNALILFGKFLKKTGQHDDALALFLKADQTDSNIAVIKQELGNYLVESDQPMEAFPFFLMTTRLEPNEPIYHHNLGNFIFLFQERLTNMNEAEKMGQLMHESFKEAARLAPSNFDYQLRYAQSFFDFNSSNKDEALVAWEVLIKEFGERSEMEMDYLKLGKARVLIDLKRHEEAIPILNSIKSISVLEQKNYLLRCAIDKKPKPNMKSNKQSSDAVPILYNPSLKSGYRKVVPFLSDPHLEKIKRITKQLFEDRMLRDFKRDVRKAKFLSTGELSLEISVSDGKTHNFSGP